MTTTKSFSNGQMFLSEYKNAFYKVRWASLIYLIFSFIIYPGMYISTIKSRIDMAVSNVGIAVTENMVLNGFCGKGSVYTEGANIFYMLLLIAVTVLLGITVNSYMHSKKQLDVYHALPVKREIMLMANYLAVATVIIVPMVICYLSVVGINAWANSNIFNPLGFEISSAGLILAEMGRMIIYVLAILSIIFLSSVCANTTLDAVIFSASMAEIIPLSGFLSSLIFQIFLKGFALNMELLSKAVLFSPVNMLFCSVTRSDRYNYYRIINSENMSLMTVVWGILAVVILALAVLIYKRRRSEIAQSADIRGLMYKVVMSVGVFGIATVSAIITAGLSGNNVTGIITIISAGIYGFLYYFILQGIFTRSMKLRITNHMVLIICILAAPLFIVFARTGWFGYESYLPKPEKIKSASIDYYGIYHNDNVWYENDNGISQRMISFTGEEEKEVIRNLHKYIIDSKKKNYNDDDITYFHNTIEYELTNGKKVRREYSEEIPRELYNTLNKLNESPEMKAQKCTIFNAPSDKILELEITTGLGEEIKIEKKYQNGENYAKVIEAMQKDMLSETIKDIKEHKGAYVCHIKPVYDISNDRNRYSTSGYIITDKYVNTIAVLKEMGIDFSEHQEFAPDTRMFVTLSYYSKYGFAQVRRSNIDKESLIHYNDDMEYASNSFYNTDNTEIMKEALNKAFIGSDNITEQIFGIILVNDEGIANYLIYADDLPKEVKDELGESYRG